MSLVLAMGIHVAPLWRMVQQAPRLLPLADSRWIWRWVAGSALSLGMCDAVSGGSTVITSPTTARGTNGVPFKYRITTFPFVGTAFDATPLPPRVALPQGLALQKSPAGQLSGTPLEEGVWSIQLMAAEAGVPGRITYATLTLTIVPNPNQRPSLLSSPKSQTVTNGGDVLFTVLANRATGLTYQWEKDEVPIASATSAALSLTSVTTNQAGGYRAIVRNSFGAITSEVAILTVLLPPTITEPPASTTLFVADPFTLHVTASGTPPLTFSWFFNDRVLPNVSDFQFDVPSASLSDAGDYWVVVSNAAGVVTSPHAVVSVNPRVTTPLQLSAVKVSGGRISFDVMGPSGRQCAIEESSDLVQWNERSIHSLSSGGFKFEAPISGDRTARFYRAVLK